ncbi:MAG: NAD-dependent epimerase/dehydratase family protein, partial [Rubricoccaceae bacterium]|nr:NAD-dependent epimerase/dehydratase family protein [Rubricoccaceae bacterium]
MILVTGATGFLGATLTHQLVEHGNNVRILRRETSKLDLLEDIVTHVDHAIGDVTDPLSLADAMEGASQVYHTAAIVGFGGRKTRQQLHETNVQGTANVANAALENDVERLVHVSSIAALGRREKEAGLIDETREWLSSKANTAYAVSKHLAEMEIHRAIAEGLDAVIANPAVVFGPGRSGENTMAIAEKLKAGKLPATPSGGTCVADVEDVANGLRLAMEHGHTDERYILGGENLTWVEILDTLADAMGTKRPKRVLSRRPALAVATVFELITTLT